jgi:hypothetical protein
MYLYVIKKIVYVTLVTKKFYVEALLQYFFIVKIFLAAYKDYIKLLKKYIIS